MKRLHLLCLSLTALCLPAFAGGKDELWQVTVQMSDRTSGATLTTQAHQQCLRQGVSADEIVPLRKGCRLADQQTSGSMLTFRFECTGKDRLGGDGDIDRPTPDTYSGRMQMQGISAKGRDIDIAVSFSGKRVGDCTFGETPPESSSSAPQ
jgi:hypothetical protein